MPHSLLVHQLPLHAFFTSRKENFCDQIKMIPTRKHWKTKRSTESKKVDKVLVKKQRYEYSTLLEDSVVVNQLSLLSSDEISCVLDFLLWDDIASVLMLSLSCKFVYQKVENILRSIQPFVFVDERTDEEENGCKEAIVGVHEVDDTKHESKIGEVACKVNNTEKSGACGKEWCKQKQNKWSITRALRTRQGLIFTTDTQVAKIEELMHREQIFDLSRLTNHLAFYYVDSQKIVQFLSGFISGKSLVSSKIIKTELISFPWKNQKGDEINEKMIEEINTVPGFFLESLTLHIVTYSMMELYQILACCRSLISLSLKFHRTFGIELISPKNINIPVFHSLKKLSITTENDCADSVQLFYDLLRLAPNLEHLECIFSGDFNDNFLTFLTKQCPKLKKLHVLSDDRADEHEFSDEGILNLLSKLPNLTDLEFHNCYAITGEVFTKIGQYGKHLKNLNIERYDGEVEEYGDIHFGGGELTALECLTFQGDFNEEAEWSKYFTSSIIQTAPNLKHLKGNFHILDMALMLEQCQKLNTVVMARCTQSVISKLIMNHNMETIDLISQDHCPFSVDSLRSCLWPKLKVLNLRCVEPPKHCDEWLLTLTKACPNLQRLILCCHFQDDSAENERALIGATMYELLKIESNWPDLRVVFLCDDSGSTQESLLDSYDCISIRPFLFVGNPTKVDYSFKRSTHGESSMVEFIRQWIVYDPIMRNNEKEVDY